MIISLRYLSVFLNLSIAINILSQILQNYSFILLNNKNHY